MRLIYSRTLFYQAIHYTYSRNLCQQSPLNKGQLLYNGQAPRSQMNSLCTKQPLNKGHLCIKAKTLFPKGVRYRGVPLYIHVPIAVPSYLSKSRIFILYTCRFIAAAFCMIVLIQELAVTYCIVFLFPHAA